MKKLNKLSRIKKISLVLTLAIGITAFLSFTKFQQAHSKTNLEVMTDGDDDEPLSSSCGGTERWSEKVFTDADAGSIDFAHPHISGITHIVGLPTVTPGSSQARILPQDSVYTITCKITEFRPESDSDCHLVCTDGVNTMVCEVPDPGCSSVAASPKVADFITCRDWVHKNLGYVINTSVNIPTVVITGVSYYDPPHGQSGAAPNNMELHSVIDIHFQSVTGIPDLTPVTGVNVFPNPCNGAFNIALTSQNKAQVLVYNMLGEEVYSGPLANGNNVINMTSSTKGVYLYKVISETGAFITSGKMMID